jgi:hypothetical protein
MKETNIADNIGHGTAEIGTRFTTAASRKTLANAL